MSKWARSSRPTDGLIEAAAPEAQGRVAGMLLALLAALGYGAIGVFAGLARGAGLALVAVLAWRFTLSATLLSPVAIPELRRIRPSVGLLLRCMLLGAVGFASEALAYFGAIERLGAGRSAVLLYSYPSVVLLLEWRLSSRRPSGRQFAALGLGIAGCCLTVYVPGGDHGGIDPVGVAMALGTGIIYAVYMVVGSRVTKAVGAVPSAWAVSVGAGLSFWLLTALTQATAWPGGPSLWMTWAGLVGLATMGTLIPLAAVFGSMKRLGPTRTALLSLSEPVFATLLGVIVLGEDMTILRAVGALLVVAAGVLAVR